MRRVTIVPNLTRAPAGEETIGGLYSHSVVSDDSLDSYFGFNVRNEDGRPAGTMPHWWHQATLEPGRIVRARLGIWASTRGAIPMISAHFPESGDGWTADVEVSPDPKYLEPFQTNPEVFRSAWSYTKWGTNRAWRVEDLEYFMFVPWSKFYSRNISGSKGVRVHRVFVDIEYADEDVAKPYDIRPENGEVVRSANPFFSGAIVKHPDGVKQKVQWQVSTSSDFSTLAVNMLSPSYWEGSIGAHQEQWRNPQASVLDQGTYFIRARTLEEFNTVTSDWTTPTSFRVSHPPLTTPLVPEHNETIPYGPETGFQFNVQDPWTYGSVTAVQVQVWNKDTDTLIADTGKTTNFKTIKRYSPAKSNSATYTAPREVDLQVNLTVPASAKGYQLAWHVRAWDEDDVISPWSRQQRFITADKPTATIIEPYSQASTGSPEVRFQFTPPDPVTELNYAIVEVLDRASNRKVYSAFLGVRDDGQGAGPAYITDFGKVPGYAATMEKFAVQRPADNIFSFQPKRTFLVNGGTYVVRVIMTAANGLQNTVQENFTAVFEHPTPVTYEVDYDNVVTRGGVLVRWANAVADSDFIRWRVYRKKSGDVEWSMIYETERLGRTSYIDYMFEPNKEYSYTVSQVVERDGSILESPLGYRGLPSRQRFNAITNPQFMFDSEGWTSTTGNVLRTARPTAITNEAPKHPYVLAVSAPAGSTPEAFHVIQPMYVQANVNRFYASIKAYSAYAGMGARVEIHFANTAGEIVGSHIGPTYPMRRDSWTRLDSGIAESPIVDADVSATMTVRMVDLDTRKAPSIKSSMMLKGAMLDVIEEYEMPNYTYFDGDTMGATWAGTRGASQSYLINTVQPEGEFSVLESPQFMLVNNDDPDNVEVVRFAASSHSFSDEVEMQVSNVIGRGRHVDYGSDYGQTGSLSIQLRGVNGRPAKDKEKLQNMARGVENLYLRIPFGSLLRVAISNPSFDHLPGTGMDEMLDVTFDYHEVR